MMKDNGVWLSLQPLLNDEDALQFPNPESTRKYEEVTRGTDRVYTTAKELGVKMAFGAERCSIRLRRRSRERCWPS